MVEGLMLQSHDTSAVLRWLGPSVKDCHLTVSYSSGTAVTDPSSHTTGCHDCQEKLLKYVPPLLPGGAVSVDLYAKE
eukprot:5372795-Amphidinium_carterae.2